MKINWKIRIKNPVFWMQLLGSMGITVLAYSSIQPHELSNWPSLFDLIKGVAGNPYLIGLCLWNTWSALNDPTTSGLADSARALGYNEPNKK